MNEYERERLRKVEQNKARLAALGLSPAPLVLEKGHSPAPPASQAARGTQSPSKNEEFARVPQQRATESIQGLQTRVAKKPRLNDDEGSSSSSALQSPESDDQFGSSDVDAESDLEDEDDEDEENEDDLEEDSEYEDETRKADRLSALNEERAQLLESRLTRLLGDKSNKKKPAKEELKEFKILLTNVKNAAEIKKAVHALGGSLVDNVRGCSHLVSDLPLKRTPKLLEAIRYAKFFVTTSWVTSSLKNGRFLGENDFVLRDFASEKFHQYDLRESVAKSKERLLFKELIFTISPEVGQPDIVQRLIEVYGGSVVAWPPLTTNAITVSNVIPDRQNQLTCEAIFLSILRQSLPQGFQDQ